MDVVVAVTVANEHLYVCRLPANGMTASLQDVGFSAAHKTLKIAAASPPCSLSVTLEEQSELTSAEHAPGDGFLLPGYF